MKITKNQRISTLERQLAALITLVKMKGYNAIDQRIEALEEFVTYADNMLTELNHALPDPEHDAKCEAQETDVDASLARHRERLGLNKPQLKQLDQSIFDGLDEKWRFAAVDADGTRCDYETKPRLDHAQWACVLGGFRRHVGEHDASNWQNSLIERDIAKELAEVDLSSELTGSDLARAMFERGDKYISGFGHHQSDGGAVYSTFADTVTRYSHCFHSAQNSWDYFVPINNQGEPLTASEVGL